MNELPRYLGEKKGMSGQRSDLSEVCDVWLAIKACNTIEIFSMFGEGPNGWDGWDGWDEGDGSTESLIERPETWRNYELEFTTFLRADHFLASIRTPYLTVPNLMEVLRKQVRYLR
jgi:hypothetical protein